MLSTRHFDVPQQQSKTLMSHLTGPHRLTHSEQVDEVGSERDRKQRDQETAETLTKVAERLSLS